MDVFSLRLGVFALKGHIEAVDLEPLFDFRQMIHRVDPIASGRNHFCDFQRIIRAVGRLTHQINNFFATVRLLVRIEHQGHTRFEAAFAVDAKRISGFFLFGVSERTAL